MAMAVPRFVELGDCGNYRYCGALNLGRVTSGVLAERGAADCRSPDRDGLSGVSLGLPADWAFGQHWLARYPARCQRQTGPQ